MALTTFEPLSDVAKLRWEKKINKTDSCWLWTAGKKNGYGLFILDSGGKVAAHRYAYYLANGQFDENLSICHNCPGGDNPKW